MGRRGRKRKDGARHPSGQLVRATKAPDDRIRTSRQPHRRMLKEDDRLDERAESPLGRLLLKGFLGADGHGKDRRPSEAAQLRYDAGTLFAQIVGTYRATIGVPKGTAGSGRGRDDCDPEGCAAATKREGADNVLCHCRWSQQRYDNAFESIGDRYLQKLISRVVIHGQAVEPQDIVYLVSALDRLTRHFGLTAGRTMRHSRNAN